MSVSSSPESTDPMLADEHSLAGSWSVSLLWVIWFVLLGGGLAAETVGHTLGSAAGRLGSSVVLVLAGCAWSQLLRDTAVARYTRLVAWGITLGAMGDFFMADLMSFIPLPSPVLGGMASFGLGHLCYIAACFHARQVTGLTSSRAMWRSIAVWQVISAVGWFLVVFLSTQESTRILVWPALPYSQLLAGTAGVATGLAVQNGRFRVLAVGAALFLISDLVLAWGMFRGTFPFRTEAVWSTYGGGQMMIVYAIAFARPLFGVTKE